MRRVVAVLLLSLPVVAPSSSRADAFPNETEQRIVQSDLFLQAHPDIHYRLRALQKIDRDDLPGALADLHVAARHADKPAQAILAEMYWTGRGVPQDRALGYVWMDLAAERGYPLMIAKREAYWAALDPEGRAAALARGAGQYAEYGDAAARPRLEELMERARRNFRRSHAHSVGASRTNILVGDRFMAVDGHDFVDKKYWTPEGYFAWQDEHGGRNDGGRVEVGDILQTAED